MLRYNTDVRSLFFMFLTAFVLVVLWRFGFEMNSWLFFVVYTSQLLLAVIVSVMVHNHQHLPMWRNKWLNIFTDNYLSIFYGFPVFAWIPTHNTNHHVHINKEPDYTKTYMVSEKNNLLTLLSYPTLSGMAQQKAVGKYLSALWNENRRKFYFHLLQIISIVLWVVIALLIDWKKALVFVIIPQQFSLFSVLIFNYVQHIHADEESQFNHSRNMTGKVLNFLMLNNGYHTAHHISPGIHWSRLSAKHAEIAGKINSSLNENNFAWYLFRNYILGIFIPSCRTKSMRLQRLEKAASIS